MYTIYRTTFTTLNISILLNIIFLTNTYLYIKTLYSYYISLIETYLLISFATFTLNEHQLLSFKSSISTGITYIHRLLMKWYAYISHLIVIFIDQLTCWWFILFMDSLMLVNLVINCNIATTVTTRGFVPHTHSLLWINCERDVQ